MLQARWKGGTTPAGKQPETAGERVRIRSFRIVKLDRATEEIELELA